MINQKFSDLFSIKTIVLVQASARSGTKILTQDEQKWFKSDPIFYDSVHTNDLGNGIISDKIFGLTLPMVLKSDKIVLIVNI